MTSNRPVLTTLVVLLGPLALSTVAHAQATRTWVSGVGDDVNPCSRTAPCKTFAGAISKTAAGGEISVLDPGGFGSVTITKAITINGDGTLAGILAAGTQGVIVNAGVNDVVILRSISINGAGTGLNGVRYLAGRALHIENCSINGFGTHGIDVVHTSNSTPGHLSVVNTTIMNIGSVGVRVAHSGSAPPSAMLANVRISRASIGFDLLNSSVGMIRDSVISNVNAQGVVAEGSSVVNVNRCSLLKNGTGVSAFSAGSTIRIADTQIFNNTTGVNVAAGATGDRFGNSQVFGNGTDVSGALTFRTSQ